ncbi:unnamed protein product [Amoebophrya sp. A25]|nr:unnamed protein product [Amoebophrya sp. A25]|eukprot:GSA25T00002759001.1
MNLNMNMMLFETTRASFHSALGSVATHWPSSSSTSRLIMRIATASASTSQRLRPPSILLTSTTSLGQATPEAGVDNDFSSSSTISSGAPPGSCGATLVPSRGGLFSGSRTLFAPQNRRTSFAVRRRRLFYFLDKYQFLMKVRRERARRRLETENRWLKTPIIHEFRFPGFWGQTFPYEPLEGSMCTNVGEKAGTGGQD